LFFLQNEPVDRKIDIFTTVPVFGRFHRLKAAATQQTSYGLSYSPHYLRQSREREKTPTAD